MIEADLFDRALNEAFKACVSPTPITISYQLFGTHECSKSIFGRVSTKLRFPKSRELSVLDSFCRSNCFKYTINVNVEGATSVSGTPWICGSTFNYVISDPVRFVERHKQRLFAIGNSFYRNLSNNSNIDRFSEITFEYIQSKLQRDKQICCCEFCITEGGIWSSAYDGKLITNFVDAEGCVFEPLSTTEEQIGIAFAIMDRITHHFCNDLNNMSFYWIPTTDRFARKSVSVKLIVETNGSNNPYVKWF